MSEVKALLASLDEMRGKGEPTKWHTLAFNDDENGYDISSEKHNFCSGPEHKGAIDDELTADYIVALHNAYPTLRSHIERLEREAEAGRVLADEMQNMPEPPYDRTGAEWLFWRQQALARYRFGESATQDLKSKE